MAIDGESPLDSTPSLSPKILETQEKIGKFHEKIGDFNGRLITHERDELSESQLATFKETFIEIHQEFSKLQELIEPVVKSSEDDEIKHASEIKDIVSREYGLACDLFLKVQGSSQSLFGGGTFEDVKKEVSPRDFYLEGLSMPRSASSVSSFVGQVKMGLIDKVVSGRALPENTKISIVLKEKGGFGDLAFVKKTAEALKKRNMDVNIVACNGQGMSSEATIKTLRSLGGLEGISIFTKSEARSSETVQDSEVTLVAPCFVESAEIDEIYGAASSKPQVEIREYGYRRYTKEYPLHEDLFSYPVSAGLGADELGVFTEAEDIETGESHTQPELIDSISNREVKDCIFAGKSVDAYQGENKMFFGYAHSAGAMNHFLHTIVADQLEDTANIDMLLPWRTEDSYEAKKSPCKLELDFLREKGIGRVEIVSLKNASCVSSEIPLQEGGKTLRIINAFPLINEDFKTLLRASEAEVLITGDQSWSDAASIPTKRIIYEKMDWKHGFHSSVLDIAEKIHPTLKGFFEAGTEMKRTETLEKLKELRALDAEASVTSGGRTGVSITNLFHKAVMRSPHDLSQGLVKMLDYKLLAEVDRDLGEIIIDSEKKIKESFSLPVLLDKAIGDLMEGLCIKMNSGGVPPPYKIEYLSRIREEWDKCNKDILSEEQKTSIETAFKLVVGEATDRGVIISTLRAIKSFKSSLLPLCEIRFKEMVGD